MTYIQRAKLDQRKPTPGDTQASHVRTDGSKRNTTEPGRASEGDEVVLSEAHEPVDEFIRSEKRRVSFPHFHRCQITPTAPLASSCSETIKYPNDPDGEPLQSPAYFCSRDLFHSLDQTGKSEGRTGYF